MSDKPRIELKQGGAGTGRVWLRASCLTCGTGVFQGGAAELPPPLNPFAGLLKRFDAASREHVCDEEGAALVRIGEHFAERGGRPRLDWQLRLLAAGIKPTEIEKRAKRLWIIRHDDHGYYTGEGWSQHEEAAKRLHDWEAEAVNERLCQILDPKSIMMKGVKR